MTPGILPNRESGPQNQPSANVAVSVLSDAELSMGGDHHGGHWICFDHNRDLPLFRRFHFVTPLNGETKSQKEGSRSY
jgi:hypothetical protein